VLSPGPEKRATLKGSTSTCHETEHSEHHSSSEFCGNCHNNFNPTNNFPIDLGSPSEAVRLDDLATLKLIETGDSGRARG